MDLTGKKALVTGAAQGIGLAIASRLAACGASVVLADLSLDKAAAAAADLAGKGATAKPLLADVSTRSGAVGMAAAAADMLGGLDILVNNAGILHTQSIEETTEDAWDKVLAVNLKGVFFSVQGALPFLEKSSAPRIINLASMAGRMGGFKTGLAYTASKGGVISLGMGLARQLAPRRITVNTICPGTTESEIIKAWTPETIAELESKIPLGRLGRVEDVAGTVAFFASDAAAFITGACLDVNGGMFIG